MNRYSNKSLPQLLKIAQRHFNEFIRLRDADKGCISCSGPVEHAGHYLSVGHNAALRFNEVNVNGQCLRCNYHLHGNAIHYRNGLIKRYGEQKVLLLESNARQINKMERVEVIAIIQQYLKQKKAA